MRFGGPKAQTTKTCKLQKMRICKTCEVMRIMRLVYWCVVFLEVDYYWPGMNNTAARIPVDGIVLKTLSSVSE